MRTKNMILASLVLAGSAFGQAAEVAAPAANQINLLDLIKTGGWAMWPLGGFLGLYGDPHRSKLHLLALKSALA